MSVYGTVLSLGAVGTGGLGAGTFFIFTTFFGIAVEDIIEGTRLYKQGMIKVFSSGHIVGP